MATVSTPQDRLNAARALLTGMDFVVRRKDTEPTAWLITWNDPTYRGKQTVSFDKCSPDDGTCEPLYK